MHASLLLALASSALVGTASAAGAVQGFNCGNKKAGDQFKVQADYEKEFKAYHNLAGTDGAYTSARLYTMIQGGAGDGTVPNEAFPAALKTNTSLLLGLWTSGDPIGFKKEIAALRNAFKEYPNLINIVDGISVGSEDLYRDSEMGIKNKAGLGVGPAVIVDCIKQVRAVLEEHKDEAVKKVLVGHVDTWTAWVNGTNKEVIDNCDWVGVDAYPYWQATMANNISAAGTLFFDAMDQTKAAAGDVPVWITETGWPVKGNLSNLATADTETAELFYKGVGCKVLGDIPTWWYILNEEGASPDFSVADTNYEPLFDLSCKNADKYDPLMEGSKSDNSTDSGDEESEDSEGSDDSGSSGTSTSAESSSESSGSSSGANPTVTAGSAAPATHAANCMFALVLAGVVALMI